MGYASAVGKAAFALGLAGSLILGLLLFSKMVRREYTGTVVSKPGTHSTCPTLWVSWDQPLDAVPEGFLKCGCAEQAPPDPAGIAVHPPKEVADTAAPQDVIVLTYVEATSLGGTKQCGVSYAIQRGTNRQSFTITPSSGIYTSIAGTSAIPAGIGIVLGALLGLIPQKKGAA
jgi:hypothetical protein